MKYIKSLFILSMMYVIIYAQETIDDRWITNAINEERVLCQQMLKEYAFLGMGNKFGNSKDKLEIELSEYEKVSEKLKQNIHDKRAKDLLFEADELWKPIKETLSKTPSKKHLPTLQKHIDKLLFKQSALMKIISEDKASSEKEIVNISSYQGVIIERMGSLYMMKTWGVMDPKFNFKMRESITFFNNSMYNMLDSELTSEENKKSIKRLMRSFKFFEIMNRSSTKFIPTLIYKKTEQIHKEIKNITKRYMEGK